MAIRAKDCDVSSDKGKTSLFVARQRKPRGLEALQVVTRLATVLVRRSGKLPFVNILVTVLTIRACDFVQRVFTLGTLGQMALVAGNRDMTAIQWIFCCRVIFDAKRRRLESIDRVAGRTFPAVHPRQELAFVRVLVAVRALCKRHGRLEVAARVAVGTFDGCVFAKQRIFRFSVIESLQLSDLAPVGRVMTRLARGGKTALVGIGMACRTFRKGEAGVFHIRFCVGNGDVALRARRLFVRPGERILGFRMVEE